MSTNKQFCFISPIQTPGIERLLYLIAAMTYLRKRWQRRKRSIFADVAKIWWCRSWSMLEKTFWFSTMTKHLFHILFPWWDRRETGTVLHLNHSYLWNHSTVNRWLLYSIKREFSTFPKMTLQVFWIVNETVSPGQASCAPKYCPPIRCGFCWSMDI